MTTQLNHSGITVWVAYPVIESWVLSFFYGTVDAPWYCGAATATTIRLREIVLSTGRDHIALFFGRSESDIIGWEDLGALRGHYVSRI
ncbi:hypothetical protein TNCV_2203491 [Trichonephila clavipes]|nr:hypothetical protein TNCV_2203491 [Trichonephila clavipes]